MGSKKNVDMSATTDEVKIVENTQAPAVESDAETAAPKAEKKAARIRSKKYVATRSQVDKTKIYDAFSAIELTKKLSYSKFDGSITVMELSEKLESKTSLRFPTLLENHSK